MKTTRDLMTNRIERKNHTENAMTLYFVFHFIYELNCLEMKLKSQQHKYALNYIDCVALCVSVELKTFLETRIYYT